MFEAKPYQPPPVDYDEMSFAIALFVAAARGRVAVQDHVPDSIPERAKFSRDERPAAEAASLKPLVLLDPLVLQGAKAVLQGEPARLPDDVHLVCAVSVLWHHYERDRRQQAICSRLVAFHALMARQQGELANSWLHAPEAFLVEAALSPAMVRAVATARVGEDGLFDEGEFRSLVESYSSREQAAAFFPRHVRPAHHEAARLSVTEDVQQLSLQLFAFQSCVAPDPTRPTPYFRTLEQVCIRVEDISGTATLQAMLSRVWREALPQFPWLRSTPPASARLLSDLDSSWPSPTAREAMKCEMVILGFLIELLRTLLGDAVTVQLLRSLWPLADLGGDSRMLPRSSDVRANEDLRSARRTQ